MNKYTFSCKINMHIWYISKKRKRYKYNNIWLCLNCINCFSSIHSSFIKYNLTHVQVEKLKSANSFVSFYYLMFKYFQGSSTPLCVCVWSEFPPNFIDVPKTFGASAIRFNFHFHLQPSKTIFICEPLHKR
jgi:hypothetical protein